MSTKNGESNQVVPHKPLWQRNNERIKALQREDRVTLSANERALLYDCYDVTDSDAEFHYGVYQAYTQAAEELETAINGAPIPEVMRRQFTALQKSFERRAKAHNITHTKMTAILDAPRVNNSLKVKL